MTNASDTPLEFSRTLLELETQFKDLRSYFGKNSPPDLMAALAGLNRNLIQLRQKSNGLLDRLTRLEGLVQTFSLISSSLEIDQVLEHVMDTIIDLTGAERAYLMLHDELGGELIPRVARNWDRENLTETDIDVSNTVVQTAIRTQTTVIATNALDDDRFQQSQSIIAMTLRSVLCIPLLVQEQVVGVLYADNRVRHGIFDKNLIPVLTAFGQQAAIAITNARKFAAVQQKLQHLEILVDDDKVEDMLAGITDSDYFKELLEMKRAKRNNTRAE